MPRIKLHSSKAYKALKKAQLLLAHSSAASGRLDPIAVGGDTRVDAFTRKTFTHQRTAYKSTCVSFLGAALSPAHNTVLVILLRVIMVPHERATAVSLHA